MDKPKLVNKIAIVVKNDLLSWQKLNVTAFLASSIAGHFPETMGKDFVDASNVHYLGMFRQPVMIFEATGDKLKEVYKKARERELSISLYTTPLFSTQGDQNIEAVAKVKEEDQDFVGLIFYGAKNKIDKTLKGLKLHS